MRKILLVCVLAGLPYFVGVQGSTERHLPQVRTLEDVAIISGDGDLELWNGLPNYWYEQDRIINGRQSENAAKHTFLVYPYALHNFKFQVQYRFLSDQGNSGIQFRSRLIDPKTFRVGGYQADIDASGTFDGSIYDEASVAGGRGALSSRGNRTVWSAENEKHETAFAGPIELGKMIHIRDWNELELEVCGNFVSYGINGHVMTELVDNSPQALNEGILALQLHEGLAMHVQFKNGRLKLLEKCN